MSDGDEQYEAEVLDDDKLDRANFPPDEPLGLPELLGRDADVTGDYAPDSLAERIAREEPDVIVADDGTAPALLDDRPDGLTDLDSELAEPDAEDVISLSEAEPLRDPLAHDLQQLSTGLVRVGRVYEEEIPGA